MPTVALQARPHHRLTWVALAVVLALAASLTAAVISPARAERSEGSSPAVADAQRRIAAGALHSCAVLDTGQVQCWGANDDGQLGNGTLATTNAPQVVQGITTALEVTAGASHTCARLHGGTVACWGLNGSGQLGDGTAVSRTTPVMVSGLTGAVAVAAGSFHTCAIVAGGGARCWGHDGSGQLGDGVNEGPASGTSLVPVTVTGLADAVGLAGGEFHTCAVRTTGGVSCWGHNGFGQLGDGTKTDSLTPVNVSGIPDGDGDLATSVAAGNGHTCAVLDDGKARCWGANDRGQLGDGTKTGRTTPVVVQFDADPSPLDVDEVDVVGVTSVSAGAFHACSRIVGGSARCWGDAGRGQLGDGTTGDEHDHIRKLAVGVAGLAGISAVTTGGFHTCALAGTALSCWGYNFHAQLGSYKTSSLVPVTVTALRGAALVGTGTNHACALVDVEAVPGTPPYDTVCWGSNGQGQLGAGLDPGAVAKTVIRLPVPGAPPASAVSAGNGHVCVLPVTPGTPSCWGRNDNGQLGNGSTADATAPVTVSGLGDATQISAHGALFSTELGHTCARRSGGTAQCWGANGFGQLGDASTTGRSTPVTVVYDDDNDSGTDPVALGGITQVAAGGRHSCALLSDSKVRCWGRNFFGQLGDDSVTDRPTAVQVLIADDGDSDTPRVALSGVAHLAAGENHTCAVMGDGKVNCWGNNASGQLGDDTVAERHTPVEVKNIPEPTKPLTKAVRITAGDDHNCVLVQTTGLRCWGENGAGQLGDGTTTDRRTPVGPTGLGDPDDDILDNVPAFIYDVSAGRSDTCAVMLDTTVSCWGDNADGQLGDGVGVAALAPLPVLALGAGVNGNHIPNPGDDALATTIDVAVSFPPAPNLLANDTDADAGDTLVAALGTPPAHGSAVVNADGSGSYSPEAGYCGTDPFTYTVTDAKATVAATVTVTIPCPNSPPAAGADAATVLEDGSVLVDVLANDSDVDGDPLSITSAGAPGHGTAVVEAGRIRYTPAADWCTTDAFTYTLSDGPGGHTTPGTVTISITCVNDPPVATDDAIATAEDTPVTADLTANDPDPDGPTIAVLAFSQPAHGTVVADGPSSVIYTPAPDHCGADSFGYTVSDGTASSSATVAVTVSCAQDGPVANDDAATTGEDTPVTRSVLGNDVDPDGDALSVVAVGPAVHGSATFTATTVTFTPETQYCGPASVGYTVSDGTSTDTATLAVTVNCVNDAPLAVDDAPATPEDTAVVVDPLANDSDPDGDPLTLVAVTGAAHGTVALLAGGTVRYTPAADYCGADAFTYTVADGHGGTDTGGVAVAVGCVNDAPVLAPIGDRSGPWGSPIALVVSASDPDAGDVLTYSLLAPPAGASIDPSSGAFTWTPTAAQLGAATITVRADDGLVTDTRSFTVTVTPQAPALVYTGSTSGQYSDTVTVSATLRDGGAVGVPGRSVSFTIASQSVSATTDADGVATAGLTLTDAAGPWTVQAVFAGDATYGAVSATTPFTILKESVTVAFSAPNLVTTTGSSAAAPLAAVVTETPDGSPGSALGGVQVSFRHLGGAVLCSATAVPGPAGQATATCTAPALAIGSRALIVSTSSSRYAGPVDVAVSTVAKVGSGSAAGAGRVGGSDGFGFQAVPVRKGAPVGDAIHIYRANGYAYVVRSSSLTSLTVACTSGKARTCSATVQAGGATTTPVLLGDGTPGSPTGSAQIRVDATDVAEPVGGSVPPDRYAVAVTGPSAYTLGSPTGQVLLTGGNIRIPA